MERDLDLLRPVRSLKPDYAVKGFGRQCEFEGDHSIRLLRNRKTELRALQDPVLDGPRVVLVVVLRPDAARNLRAFLLEQQVDLTVCEAARLTPK